MLIYSCVEAFYPIKNLYITNLPIGRRKRKPLCVGIGVFAHIIPYFILRLDIMVNLPHNKAKENCVRHYS